MNRPIAFSSVIVYNLFSNTSPVYTVTEEDLRACMQRHANFRYMITGVKI